MTEPAEVETQPEVESPDVADAAERLPAEIEAPVLCKLLVRHRFSRAGQPKEYRSAHVYTIRDGKLMECWEQPRDPAVFDDAWA